MHVNCTAICSILVIRQLKKGLPLTTPLKHGLTAVNFFRTVVIKYLQNQGAVNLCKWNEKNGRNGDDRRDHR